MIPREMTAFLKAVSEPEDARRIQGLAIPAQLAVDLFKPGHHLGYTIPERDEQNEAIPPADAVFERGDFDIVTNELLIVYRSPSLPVLPKWSLAFPFIMPKPDGAAEAAGCHERMTDSEYTEMQTRTDACIEKGTEYTTETIRQLRRVARVALETVEQIEQRRRGATGAAS